MQRRGFRALVRGALAFASILLLPATVAAQQPAPTAAATMPGETPSSPGMPPGGAWPAPAYYPPPMYYQPPMAVPPPPTLPYEDGQTVPQGYELRKRPVRSSVITGAATFGGAYLTSMVVGATLLGTNSSTVSQIGPLFAPVVGPFVTIGTTRAQGVGTLWLALDGIAQVAGATVLIYGLAADERYLHYNDARGPEGALFALTHPQVFAGPLGGMARWRF